MIGGQGHCKRTSEMITGVTSLQEELETPKVDGPEQAAVASADEHRFLGRIGVLKLFGGLQSE